MNELTKELLDALKACVDYGSMTGAELVKEKAVAVISKAEAEMAEPKPDADGWIKWDGGGCPVRRDALVWVRLRDGYEECDDAATFRWRHVGDDACDQFAVEEGDIIAYRIVKVPQ